MRHHMTLHTFPSGPNPVNPPSSETLSNNADFAKIRIIDQVQKQAMNLARLTTARSFIRLHKP